MNYVPNSDVELQEMLKSIGVDSVEELFEVVPKQVRFPKLDLPKALSELETTRLMNGLASRNWNLRDHASFLGAGSYNHYVPSVVGHLVGRSEFYTAYTPYQPEVSQGTLQAIYEYQTMMGELFNMDVSNASMYDGASALAEAAIMAVNVTNRNKVIIPKTVHPDSRAVTRTYTEPQGIVIAEYETMEEAVAALDDQTAALLVQQPDFLGQIQDLKKLADAAHAKGALFVVSAYPTSLGLLKPPGECGADIAVGEGQSLGMRPSFGGPYVGIFTCRNEYIRNLPGRIVGQTTDKTGKRAFVLTLQTREQHIRREKATSNICTNEGLIALVVTVYLSAMGKQGLHEVAEQCYHKAHYAADEIAKLPGYSLLLEGAFFNEFLVRVPNIEIVQAACKEAGIIGGYALGKEYPQFADCLLFCCTEMNTREEIDCLVEVLRGA
ncbi:MAG: aminomethyl-transferring glycine dehydrogenase subunit GcvPA [Chloroflexi bacterium]|uniref:Probable glycine dehydrogenase (decarboxylating) subunit 1 n=1 Tax=Candidatus Chlorohelix allophototropha TaxID=3003348 RepID=A0A8T7M7V1_9CHLR|nr:aminomethyl-transferring glycine dehydrogenase subunit GcvPA [Chloroflexota bacterium]WJW68047.1 aminomethyl-transferring glycine dehydrogenase subunit GcvPA [Chloroflexota bacterium L227-S17]